MNFIIYDLEWNNASYIKSIKFNNENCPNEIIEIGAVKVNENLEIIDKFYHVIKPKIYKNILDRRLTKMSGITKEDLKKGKNFELVINNFLTWIGNENYILCTWGTDDMAELKSNCNHYGIEIDWIKESLNIQKIFMDKFNMKNQISVENALKLLEIEIDNGFHRALYDALYTSQIFQSIYNHKNINIKKYLYCENAYKPKLNIDLKSLKLDKTKMKIKCPNCGRFTKVSDAIMSKNKYFKALGYCNKCNVKIYHRTRIAVYTDGSIEYKNFDEIIDKDSALKFKKSFK